MDAALIISARYEPVGSPALRQAPPVASRFSRGGPSYQDGRGTGRSRARLKRRLRRERRENGNTSSVAVIRAGVANSGPPSPGPNAGCPPPPCAASEGTQRFDFSKPRA